MVEATGTYDARPTGRGAVPQRARAPPASTSSPRWSPHGRQLCWSTAAGSPPKATGNAAPDVPAPPSGNVTVTGWVAHQRRRPGNETDTVRRLSATRSRRSAIGPTLPYDVYDGFVDLTGEDPAVDAESRARGPAGSRRRSALLLRRPVVLLRRCSRSASGSTSATRSTSSSCAAPTLRPEDGPRTGAQRHRERVRPPSTGSIEPVM